MFLRVVIKNITISYIPGNGLEDKVKFGFKYGVVDDDNFNNLPENIRNTLDEANDNGTTRKENRLSSLKSLDELPETYTLFAGAFKNASNLNVIGGKGVEMIQLDSDLTEAFSGTNFETITGIDRWNDKMTNVTSLKGFCKGCPNF